MKAMRMTLMKMNTTTFLMKLKYQIQTAPAIRYLFTVLAVALLATFIAALPSQAAWDDRFWPANEKTPRKKDGANWVFQSDVVTSNIYYAVDERIRAVAITVGIGYEEYPYGPRFADRSLHEMKQLLEPRIKDYLDQTRFSSPYDPTSAQMTNLIFWNVTNILIHCELPTNFFSYTPPRNLAGHEGTGAEHWTNSAGYGWDAMRKVITNLIYTYEPRGVMTNQTVEFIGEGLSDDQYTPSRSCEDQSGEPEEPTPFSELTLQNYTTGTSYTKDARRRLLALPEPNPPEVGNWLDRGLFIRKFYMIESSSGVNGILAARLGTSGIATNPGHIAYTFQRETADVPQACGFTNGPAWQFQGTIAGSEKSADNNYFITGGVVGYNDPACELWSEEVMGDFFGSIDDGDIFCFSCEGYSGCFISEISVFAGGTGYTSNREYVHIIQWNFQYK
jgi:hypothetical protein